MRTYKKPMITVDSGLAEVFMQQAVQVREL